MSISAKRRWRSSEDIALEFLSEQGYKILGRNIKVRINGVEVGEVDALVENDKGERYAVEIKAGSIDVNGIRQAYVNAELLGYKTMIIAKGFADESAEVLANRLGIKVYKLSDYFIVSAEELETIVSTTLHKLFKQILSTILEAPIPTPEEKRILESIVKSATVKDLADTLGLSISEAVRRIKRLQNRGILNKHTRNYQELRLQSMLILLREKSRSVMYRLENLLNSS